MPIPSQPLLTRRAVMLCRIESTAGTVNTPSAATDAFPVSDFIVRPVADAVQRDFQREDLSVFGHIIVGRVVECNFSTEWKSSGGTNSGTAAARIGRLLRACGFSEAATNAGTTTGAFVYKPRSRNFETVTIYGYYDGVLTRVAGWRGTFTVIHEVGQYARVQFTGMGIFLENPFDQVTPTTTLEASKPEVVKDMRFFLKTGSTSIGPVVQSIQLAMNNNVVKRPDVNALDSYRSIEITGRDPQLTINPEFSLVSEFDWWGNWAASREYEWGYTLGSSAGFIIETTGPRGIAMETNYGDREGFRTLEFGMRLSRSLTEGDNEVVIVMR